jgi:hypothetical protein
MAQGNFNTYFEVPLAHLVCALNDPVVSPILECSLQNAVVSFLLLCRIPSMLINIKMIEELQKRGDYIAEEKKNSYFVGDTKNSLNLIYCLVIIKYFDTKVKKNVQEKKELRK